MANELDCLSLMELLEIRQGADDDAGRAHLATCSRCRALLATIPEGLQLPELPTALSQSTGATRPNPASTTTKTGALWRALAGPADDFAWVVAIIGRAPDADGRYLVAPVIGPPATATEHDLLLEQALLGYEAFADVANAGVLLAGQLVEPLGRLDTPAASALASLYQAVLAGGPPPEPELVGFPVLDESDPRLLQADERRQSLRALWRAADRLVDQDNKIAGVDPAAVDYRQDEPHHGVSVVLAEHLTGSDAQWDRQTLLEASGADGAWLNHFLHDQLDLTDMQDVVDLARVLRTLDVGWERSKGPVELTLLHSPGGIREASGPMMPMAARGKPGATDDEVTEALYADQSTINSSDAARRKQVARYLSELRQALEELE